MTSPSTLPEPADQFLTALAHEIKAHLADNANTQEKVSLKDGERVRVGDGDHPHEYLFSCARWKDSFDSDRLLVRPSRSRQPWQHAAATAHPDGKILVTTEADLGERPGNVQLRDDETWSLNSLADRIRDCGQSPGPVNVVTAAWVLGDGSPTVGALANPNRYISGYRDMTLNKRQRQSVEQALGSDITFIWGPPGTGKTEVVSLIVEGAHRLGERILFLAPTRVAVDQALERVCERLEGEDGFDSGLVQRAGDIEVDSLRERFGSVIDPEMIAGRLGVDLSARVGELEEILELATAQRLAHERLAQAEVELGSACSLAGEITDEISQFRTRTTRSQRELDQVVASVEAIGPPSGVFAKRKAERLARLIEERDRLRSALSEEQRRIDAATARLEDVNAAITERVQERDSALAATRGLPSADEVEKLIGQAEPELAEVRKELDGLLEAVRSRCQVMGTTLSKALQSRHLLEEVDTVIIDEAGMVDLPSAWCAAGLADKRVVVAGDFRQLPAITQASGSRALQPEEQEHSRQWMDRDVFHAAGLVDPSGRVTGDPRLVALDTQYRMRPDICAVVNKVAYRDAPLTTGRQDRSRLPHSLLVDHSVVLVDTSGGRVRVGGSGRHKSNQVHEAVIHELVRGLQHDGVLPGRKHDDPVTPAQRMAVISPYRDQVKHLRNSMKYRFGQEYEGLADTVHRFQGSQRPLVIVDTVAGAGDTPGFFYSGTGMSSSTARLLNVALSRAQDHLVVIADVEHLREHLSPGSETVIMLDTLEKSAQRIPAQELVPVRSAGDLVGLSEEELRRPAFFPADEVTRALEWDLARTNESVEIYCAFLNKGPVERWLKHLTPRIAQGVRVTVFTRPVADNQDKNAERHQTQIQRLRDQGCEVRPRERMHEKVVVLDGTVLWHGSLNLLSSNGPTDLMMRLTDPDACDRVRHIVERARRDQPLQHVRQAQSEQTAPADVPSIGEVVGDRLYLKVPFHEKDKAKREVKARWDGKARLWWVSPDTPRQKLARWL
ncbi:AAA domain-containing protein [Nocardiopsis valliformis]|uniref:AAA domain-containing protein n=1 Tax=Nocardiopsis valliformis TaxID=239974 RepID=UPI00034B9E47|nr:AAA domain-containing protein [Nocardiopsis valliformis]